MSVLTQEIKRRAVELGFDACGVASVREGTDPDDNLGEWLARGFHADMLWMAGTRRVRQDVTAKLPGARSVVVLARNYYGARPAGGQSRGKVARYAWGRDYHRVLAKPLKALARHIESHSPGATTYCSVDSGPVLERTWAERAGVASIGKNSLGLRRDLGSWFFLATIITTAELAPDEPARDLCGSCTLCIDACPTAAIVEPRVVDSHRCISYQTIENRGDIPDALHAAHGEWLFGCDICQEVCPWNRFATTSSEAQFAPREDQANIDPERLLSMSEDEFNATYAGTPLRRAKYSGMQRNARIVRENLRRAT